MFTKRFSKRERMIFLATLTLGASAFCFTFIFAPAFNYVKKLHGRIESKEKRLEEYRRLLESKKVLNEKYPGYQEAVGTKTNEEAVLAKDFALIDSLSARTGCRITSIKLQPTEKTGAYKKVSFHIIAEGSLKSLSYFIYEIENAPELLRIKRFTLSAKSGASEDLTANIIVSRVIRD